MNLWYWLLTVNIYTNNYQHFRRLEGPVNYNEQLSEVTGKEQKTAHRWNNDFPLASEIETRTLSFQVLQTIALFQTTIFTAPCLVKSNVYNDLPSSNSRKWHSKRRRSFFFKAQFFEDQDFTPISSISTTLITTVPNYLCYLAFLKLYNP